jgi:PAS domain S-box-containing protein
VRIEKIISGDVIGRLGEVALLVGTDGSILDANPPALSCYGYSHAGMLALGISDIQGPQDQDATEQLRKGAECGAPFEAEHRRSGGEAFPVEVRATSVTDGGQTAWLCIVRDISERKRADRKLPAASAYSRSLIEASLDPLVTINRDGQITDVNEATEEATGVPRDRLIGTDFADYFTDPDMARAGYERVLRDGFVRDYPLSLRGVSGAVIDVEYNATVYRNQEGDVQGVFAAARDVTEWKKAHEEAARLAAIVTSSEDAIFTKDRDEIVTSWNAGAEALYGYTAEEMIGASFEILVPPGREGEARRLDERVFAGDHISGFETQRRCKDGGLLDVSVTLSPIPDDTGGIAAISVIQRDITQRKQAERERLERLRFVEDVDRVNRAIQGASDLDKMMHDVLEVVLSSLDCDRAWLFYPCDPDAPTFRVPMEVAKPEYPGAGILSDDVPLPPDMAQNLREALESAGPLTYVVGTDRPINKVSAEQFGVQSLMMVALYPKAGKPWAFGVHQCSHPREWTPEEQRLFQEIGWRLTDALTGLLSQRDLRESEEKFRALFESAIDGICLLTAEGAVVSVNEAFAQMHGYSVDEMLGMDLEDLETPEGAGVRSERVSRVLAGERMTFEVEHCRKGGHTIPLEVSTSLVTIGGTRYLLGFHRDITERRRDEAEIRFKNLILYTEQEASRDGILVVDADAHILSYNDRFVEMWRIPERLAESGTDEPLLEFVAGQMMDQPAFLERVGHLYGHRRETGRDELALADGRVFDRYSGPMLGPGGEYYGRIWYFEDITERKRAEAELQAHRRHLEDLVAERTADLTAANNRLKALNSELREATDAKSAFLASMSHELRTPLNSVIGFSSVLGQGLAGPLTDEQRIQLAMINNAGKHLLALINDVLDLAKVEAGKTEIHVEPFDPAALVREVADAVRPMATGKGLELDVDTGDATGLLDSDTSKVRQILFNLVGNAIKFTDAGRIEMSVRTEADGEFSFAVSDTGRGIEPGDLRRIFEAFVRVDNPGSPVPSGTGLGLKLSQEYTALLTGRLSVESEPGAGSVFTLTLPGVMTEPGGASTG